MLPLSFLDKLKHPLFLVVEAYLIFMWLITIYAYRGSNFKTLIYTIYAYFSKEKEEIYRLLDESFREEVVPKVEKVESKMTQEEKKEFIKKNISTNNNVIRYVLERDVRDNLLNWISFIPIKKLDINHLKEVISQDRMKEQLICNVSQMDLEYKFEKYNSKQIQRLFTTYYNFDDYLYCINIPHEESFPIKKNIKELRDYLMDMYEIDYLLSEKAPWLDKLTEDFEVVKNKKVLYDWAELMDNCLKGYDEKLRVSETIIMAYKKNTILYIVETTLEGNIIDIRGYRNELPYPLEKNKIEEEIKKALS